MDFGGQHGISQDNSAAKKIPLHLVHCQGEMMLFQLGRKPIPDDPGEKLRLEDIESHTQCEENRQSNSPAAEDSPTSLCGEGRSGGCHGISILRQSWTMSNRSARTCINVIFTQKPATEIPT